MRRAARARAGSALRHRSRKRFVIVSAATLLLPAHESFSKALFCRAASAREAGANVNRRCINTLSRPSYIVNFRSVGPGRHDPFGAIRLNTSAPLCFQYITIPTRSDKYTCFYQFSLLRMRVARRRKPNVYIFYNVEGFKDNRRIIPGESFK